MKKAGLLLSCVLFVAACDVSTPSAVSVGQIRLAETMRTEVMNAAHADSARVNVIADDYLRNGEGRISAVISYDGASPLNAIEAQRQADNFKKAFARRGVKNIEISTVAVASKDDMGKAILSYDVLTALPPPGCTPMPGTAGTEALDGAQGYKIGCETQTALSKMVAEPRDLEGRMGTPDGDSRRQGAVVEKYRSGAPNEKIEGLNASEIAGGQ